MTAMRLRLFRSRIWRQQPFGRFWLGQAISMVGSGVSDFAIPLVAVLTLQASPSQLGVLRAVGTARASSSDCSPGVWVDRVSRKRLLISSELTAAGLVTSIPVADALGPLSFEHLVVVALCFGILSPFWWPAWNAFLPSVVEPQLLFDANSKLRSRGRPPASPARLGGILVDAVGAPFALLFDAGSFVVSSAFLASVRPQVRERAGDDGGTMAARIVDGLRLTFLDPMQ